MIPGLNILGLGGNRLRATIPTEIFSLTSLTSLSLSKYHGFCLLPRLGSCWHSILNFFFSFCVIPTGQNDFTGGLPSSIQALTGLVEFYMQSNPNLGSTIPTVFGNLTNLLWLEMGTCCFLLMCVWLVARLPWRWMSNCCFPSHTQPTISFLEQFLPSLEICENSNPSTSVSTFDLIVSHECTCRRTKYSNFW